MKLALLLGWTPQTVAGLSDAELAAANAEAARLAEWPSAQDLMAALFEQMNQLYLLTWKLGRAQGLVKRGAKEPQPVEVPRPHVPQVDSQVELPPGVRSVNPKRRVLSPLDAALAFRRGEI